MDLDLEFSPWGSMASTQHQSVIPILKYRFSQSSWCMPSESQLQRTQGFLANTTLVIRAIISKASTSTKPLRVRRSSNQARRQAEAVGVHRDMLQGPVGAQRGTVLGIIHHEVVNHQATTRLQDFQGVPGAKMCVNISITGVNMWESSVVTVWFCLALPFYDKCISENDDEPWEYWGHTNRELLWSSKIRFDAPTKSQKGRIYTSRCARDRYGMASDIFQGCSGPAVVV